MNHEEYINIEINTMTYTHDLRYIYIYIVNNILD